MSTTPPEPPLTPLPPGYPPVFNGPADYPYSGYPANERQIHREWDRFTLAAGHKLPVALNKMTFYRARLKKVVS